MPYLARQMIHICEVANRWSLAVHAIGMDILMALLRDPSSLAIIQRENAGGHQSAK
jgi:hypothetical protein